MATRLIVALDYGTTFTSVSYALQKHGLSDNTFALIKDWCPGHGEFAASTVAYHKYSGQIKWGEEINYLSDRSTWDIIRFAKARLHECDENKALLKTKNWPENSDQDQFLKPVKDTLRRIYEQVIGGPNSALKKCYPTELADPNLQMTFVCGIPPAWTETEQLLFVDLMAQVGMPGAIRVPEPEAMAAFHFLRFKSFKCGDVIVIVDGGGGTTDLITYRVESLKPLRLSERAVSEGDCCGSSFLNSKFEKLILEKFGAAKRARDKDHLLRAAVDKFENMFKRNFTGTESFDLGTELQEDDEFIKVSSVELVKKVFGPVFRRVLALIHTQVETTLGNLKADWTLEKKTNNRIAPISPRIDEIVLGGGMSANPYLLNLIREEFPDITVRKMPDSRTDVANGLACIALDYGIIQQRRSTKNYGLVSQYEWERGMPSLEKLGGGIHEHTGEAQFPAVEWIIRKNQAVDRTSTFTRYRMEAWGEYSDWTTRHEIIVTDDDLPTDAGYTFWKVLGEHQVFEITTNLSGFDRSKLTQKSDNRGMKYWEVWFEVALNVTGSSISWEVHAPVKGGKVSITTLSTENNPNPALGSLMTRGLKVPQTYTQSLIGKERATKKQRRAKRAKSNKVAKRKLFTQWASPNFSPEFEHGPSKVTKSSSRAGKKH